MSITDIRGGDLWSISPDGAHCSRCPRQPQRTDPASEGSHLAGVAQHAQRSETSQGHGHAFAFPCWPPGLQRKRHPQRNSPTVVATSEHHPHVGGGPFQCCFAVVGCVSTEHVRPGMWSEFAGNEAVMTGWNAQGFPPTTMGSSFQRACSRTPLTCDSRTRCAGHWFGVRTCASDSTSV